MVTSLKPDDAVMALVRDLAAAREEARESFKAEALASWAALQANGRHLTGEEAAGWLAQWGSASTDPNPVPTPQN